MRKFLLGTSAAILMTAAPAFAAVTITPGGGEGSSTDQFNNAVTVTANSAILGGFSVQDAFGAVTSNPPYAESQAGGHVIFADTPTQFIDFNTAAPVALSGINLIVSSDGPPSDTDRRFDSVSIYGGTTPGGLTLLGTTSLAALGEQTISVSFANGLYQYFRFEGTAPNNGPRLIEIDAVSAVPEVATWAMMIGGFAMTGVALRRRKTKVVFAA